MIFRTLCFFCFVLISKLYSAATPAPDLRMLELEVESAFSGVLEGFDGVFGAKQEALRAFYAGNHLLASDIYGSLVTESIAPKMACELEKYPHIRAWYEKEEARFQAFTKLSEEERRAEALNHFALIVFEIFTLYCGERKSLEERKGYVASTFPEFMRFQEHIEIPSHAGILQVKRTRSYLAWTMLKYYRCFLSPDDMKRCLGETLGKPSEEEEREIRRVKKDEARFEATQKMIEPFLGVPFRVFLDENPGFKAFLEGEGELPHADSMVAVRIDSRGRRLKKEEFPFAAQLYALWEMGQDVLISRHGADTRYVEAWQIVLSRFAYTARRKTQKRKVGKPRKSGKALLRKGLMGDDTLWRHLLRTSPTAEEEEHAWAFLEGRADDARPSPLPRASAGPAPAPRRRKARPRKAPAAASRSARAEAFSRDTAPAAAMSGAASASSSVSAERAEALARARVEAREAREEEIRREAEIWERNQRMNAGLAEVRRAERAARAAAGEADPDEDAEESDEGVEDEVAAADDRLPASSLGEGTALRQFADLVFSRRRVLITGDAILSGLRGLADRIDDVELHENAEGCRVKLRCPRFDHPYTLHIHKGRNGTVSMDGKSTYRRVLGFVLRYDL